MLHSPFHSPKEALTALASGVGEAELEAATRRLQPAAAQEEGAASDVEWLAALAARELPDKVAGRDDELVAAAAAMTQLLSRGQALARSGKTAVGRLRRMGAQLAGGRKVPCVRAGRGGAECIVWSAEWAPLNAELPAAEHAVAAWTLAARDAREAMREAARRAASPRRADPTGSSPARASSALASPVAASALALRSPLPEVAEPLL